MAEFVDTNKATVPAGENKELETAEEPTRPPADEVMPGWNCDGAVCPQVCADPSTIKGSMYVTFTADGNAPSCCAGCYNAWENEDVKQSFKRVNTGRSAINFAFAVCAKYITHEAFQTTFQNLGVPEEEISELLGSADADSDGKITIQEFAHFYYQINDVSSQPAELGEFPGIDCDGCGSETITGVCYSTGKQKTYCRDCYCGFADGSAEKQACYPMYGSGEMLIDVFCTVAQYITKEAFTKFFTDAGAPAEEVAQMLAASDADGNGRLDMDEFIKFCEMMNE